MPAAIEVTDLRKTYGAIRAVDGVTLTVPTGEIFGLVGPNGAGKTTLIECLEGLRRADAGSVRVLGLDPQRDRQAVRQRTGVQLQSANLPNRLKVWEALDLYASFYPRPAAWPALLEQLGLADKRQASFDQLSGGQKQRLFIALALIHDPQLVFLDELTTGLDPQARHAIWDLIRRIHQQGQTVFLTTHLMEEAERLCDRVAILDHGQIVALDTPANLIRSLDLESRIEFQIGGGFTPASLQTLPGVNRVEVQGEQVVVYGRGDRLAATLFSALAEQGVAYHDLRAGSATLEDVFLSLTGRAMRD